MTTVAAVVLWGTRIGAVSLAKGDTYARFQYAPAFLKSSMEVAPLTMPLRRQPYSFPDLARESFHGLPGLLADSLPDKYGNALIDAWLARQGRSPGDFDPVERLCYVGKRGMGALEYEPTDGPKLTESHTLQVDALVKLASEILTQREKIGGSFESVEVAEDTMRDILRVGTSAGGARAKALVAWNPVTDEVRSGQVDAGTGFEYWLLKFDGVAENKDHELADPKGHGLTEYAYSKMAADAGIEMTDCRLMHENGRAHFMTRRFDCASDGDKYHLQSLGALAHYDYKMPGAYSYEQAFQVIRKLELGMDTIEEQFRRMVFNIVARNHDDHVKNIAFLMDRRGRWRLSPAFDITYAYNPSGDWTSQHQMSANNKRDGFTRKDLREVAKVASIQRGRADHIIDKVVEVIKRWPDFADEVGVPPGRTDEIRRNHRLEF